VAEPKLLFVLSNDYGELSNALYVLRGTGLDALLLLPERLFDTNRDTLQVPARRYTSPADVLAAVDREQPDVVFLFSAYLYAINGIFDLGALEALLGELRRRRLRVVTSDPFLGLLLEQRGALFSDRHPQQQALEAHFARLAAQLTDLAHLYLTPADGVAGANKIALFNPQIISDAASTQQRGPRLAARIGIDLRRPRWLFVLGSEDYGAQVTRLGRESFDAVLLSRLEDAAQAGRQPVLIAPPPCVDALARSDRTVGGLIPLSFCGYELFVDLLLEAEYVFYWNVLSNSLLARLANRLPALFFDRGHLAHVMPALLDRGLKTYFPGAELTLLDQRKRLAADALALLAAGQEQTLETALDNLRRSPTPRELIDRLMTVPSPHGVPSPLVGEG
jgi:hypothetical protein